LLEDPQLSVFLEETTRLVGRTLNLQSCGVFERAGADVDLTLRAVWESGFELESQTPEVRTVLDVEIESEGISYGILHVATMGDTELSTAQQDFLHTIAWIVARAIERDRATAVRHAREAQLTYRATHDALTDLPNRALFADRLRHAVIEKDLLWREGKEPTDSAGWKLTDTNSGLFMHYHVIMGRRQHLTDELMARKAALAETDGFELVTYDRVLEVHERQRRDPTYADA